MSALLCAPARVPAGEPARTQSSGVDYGELYQLAVDAEQTGRVQTVTGLVMSDTLGFTLMHEHLFVDFFADFPWPRRSTDMPPALFRKMQEVGWTIPVTPAQREFFARRELTLSMVNEMRRGQRSRSNLVIENEREVLEEVARYRAAGGRTIVDLTSQGLGRDPQRLLRVAQRSGIAVVAGNGLVSLALPVH